MSAPLISRLKDQANLFWIARTEQERKFLTVGGVAALVMLIYALLVAPALDGRAKLLKEQPVLAQKAAQMQALALEAGELARQSPPQVAPMTRDSLGESLAARSMKPSSLVITGDYAKIQLNAVSYANLFTWLDAQRRENRISVAEAAITAVAPLGQVDATLTLRQNTSQADAGTR